MDESILEKKWSTTNTEPETLDNQEDFKSHFEKQAKRYREQHLDFQAKIWTATNTHS